MYGWICFYLGKGKINFVVSDLFKALLSTGWFEEMSSPSVTKQSAWQPLSDICEYDFIGKMYGFKIILKDQRYLLER